MAEAETAVMATPEAGKVAGGAAASDSKGHSDPLKNTLAGGFGGICLVAAGWCDDKRIWSKNQLS